MGLFFALICWAASDARSAALVQNLGHNSHAVRSAAARDLVSAGTRAIPALTAGTKHADPDVAERCRQLRPSAAAAGRRNRLARRRAGRAGPPPKGLGGAKRFL